MFPIELKKGPIFTATGIFTLAATASTESECMFSIVVCALRDIGGNEVDVQLHRVRTRLRHLLRIIDPTTL